MEQKWQEQLKAPPPPSLTPLALSPPSPWALQHRVCSHGIRNLSLAQECTPQSGALIWSIQGQQLLEGGGVRVAGIWVALWKSSGELLLEGPWGLPPPVLRNLSLENCKFISQKCPRAKMTSKRTNHFLQSLTELGQGGCGHWRGLHSDLSTLLSSHSPPLALGQERWGPRWVTALLKALVTYGFWKRDRALFRYAISD